MNKIESYTIVFDLTPNDLIKKVNEMIKEGWQPLGGCTNWHNAPRWEFSKNNTITSNG